MKFESKIKKFIIYPAITMTNLYSLLSNTSLEVAEKTLIVKPLFQLMVSVSKARINNYYPFPDLLTRYLFTKGWDRL